MQLTDIQKAVGTVLLEKEGLKVLSSSNTWESFLQTSLGRACEGFQRERLFLYEELLFAGVEDTLGSLYPFTKRFLQSAELDHSLWYELIEEYRRAYPNRSFQLYQSAKAFPQFIADKKTILQKYPFLVDLSHYEWLEIQALNAPDPVFSSDFQLGFPQSVEGFSYWMPVLNPTATMKHYEYNVPVLLEQLKVQDEGILTTFQAEGSPVDILIYRDSDSLDARFFQLTPMTAEFIQLASQPQSYQTLFKRLYQQNAPLHATVPWDAFLQQGLGLLNQCFQKNILLGSNPIEEAEEKDSEGDGH